MGPGLPSGILRPDESLLSFDQTLGRFPTLRPRPVFLPDRPSGCLGLLSFRRGDAPEPGQSLSRGPDAPAVGILLASLTVWRSLCAAALPGAFGHFVPPQTQAADRRPLFPAESFRNPDLTADPRICSLSGPCWKNIPERTGAFYFSSGPFRGHHSAVEIRRGGSRFQRGGGRPPLLSGRPIPD